MSIFIKFQRRITVFTAFLAIVCTTYSNAQCTINSTAGYQVSVSICPQSIVVSNTDCPNGYNYNVNFTYNVQLTGAVQELYTLQTIIYCNAGQQNGYYSLPKLGGSGTAVTTTNPFINNDGAAYQYTTHPSCTQANVNNLNCASLKLIIQGPGIPYQVIDCNCNSLVLPVEFLGLTGERTPDGNLLSWSTESETRNAYFSLETSIDGKNWTKLKDIPAAGNTLVKSEYTFLDTEHIEQSTYYKLSQTDIDGTRNELAITYVSQPRSGLTVSPNPSVNSNIHVQLGEEIRGDLRFQLFNDLGQVVKEWFVEESAYKANGAVSLATPELKGCYQLCILKNQVLLERTRVIIQ